MLFDIKKDFLGRPIKPRNCRKCRVKYHAIRFTKDAQLCGICSDKQENPKYYEGTKYEDIQDPS